VFVISYEYNKKNTQCVKKSDEKKFKKRILFSQKTSIKKNYLKKKHYILSKKYIMCLNIEYIMVYFE